MLLVPPSVMTAPFLRWLPVLSLTASLEILEDSARMNATGTVTDCVDQLDTSTGYLNASCALLDQPSYGFSDRGTGVVFDMPDVGVNVIVEVRCCPIEKP